MFLTSLRASKTFTVTVVCVAVFADVLLQNLVVPVLPYALKERVGLRYEGDVQRWASVLLSAFGGSFMGGCCEFLFFLFLFLFWGKGKRGRGRGGRFRRVVCYVMTLLALGF